MLIVIPCLEYFYFIFVVNIVDNQLFELFFFSNFHLYCIFFTPACIEKPIMRLFL